MMLTAAIFLSFPKRILPGVFIAGLSFSVDFRIEIHGLDKFTPGNCSVAAFSVDASMLSDSPLRSAWVL
jgi:hypothetical protein